MRMPAALGFALLLVVAAVGPASALAVGADGAGPGADAVGQSGISPAAESPEALDGSAVRSQVDDGDAAPPRTTVEVSLRPDRSARWRVETHYALASENETRAFRTLAERYEAGDTDLGPEATLFRSLNRRASEATGREMAIENVTYHGSISEESDRGTLAVTFRWTNFLRQGENETLVLDDVFRLPTAESDDRRTWLSVFGTDQEILIRPPEGYTVTGTSIAVQQQQSAIVLAEPSDFEDDRELRVAYSPVGPADRLPVRALVGGGLVAIAALLGGAWLLRRDDEAASPSGPSPAAEGATSGSMGGNGADSEQAASVADSETEPEAAETDGPDAVSAAGTGREADDGIDPTLLSDEERVERLLSRNNGRMKQATIVDETGWSDAKVSQLLSTMADEDRIHKLRLGRENVISLPDAEGGDGNGAEDSNGSGAESGDR